MSRNHHRRWSGSLWRWSRHWLAMHPHCAIQGPGCTGKATTVDHIVPLSKGGPVADVNNWRPACAHCNYSRQDSTTDPPLSERWR